MVRLISLIHQQERLRAAAVALLCVIFSPAWCVCVCYAERIRSAWLGQKGLLISCREGGGSSKTGMATGYRMELAAALALFCWR